MHSPVQTNYSISNTIQNLLKMQERQIESQQAEQSCLSNDIHFLKSKS